MGTTAAAVLDVKNFAQIREAHIEFGDFTVLVGPQATGKSLLLQWLKVAIDIEEIVPALKQAGHDVSTSSNLLDLIFGEGMSAAWRTGSSDVRFEGVSIRPESWTKGIRRRTLGRLFYIPAHRALLLAEGWPAPFLRLNADTPVVARLFSQNLYQRFSGRQNAFLFPVERTLKKQYRDRIDETVFHGGMVQLHKAGLKYRLQLAFTDGTTLPYMTWTSGQREFTPLLLGLYHVLPQRKEKKRPGIDWVVIEEPEMGLHPAAIEVVMELALDLLWRGYRVVLSTHSPLILEVIWAIRELARNGASWKLLADAFRLGKSRKIEEVMQRALSADYRAYFLNFEPDGKKVTSKEISSLDPESSNPDEADWGGLTRFSSEFGSAVRRAVNERGA